jgi:hypothetical protein
MGMLLKEAFNFYVLFCGNTTLKQKTLHSFMACYVPVLL